MGGDESHGLHFFDSDGDRQSAVDFHSSDLGDLTVLLESEQFFQNFVELLIVGHGEDFLGSNFSVMQFDAAVGEAGDDGVVRDHDDGAALLMKLPQQA